MLKSWKYGLIKIEHPSIEEDNFCELVELYACDSQDQYISYNSGYASETDRVFNAFCRARIHSIEELSDAYNDAMKDGINTWFSENGKFSRTEDGFWDWERNGKSLNSTLSSENVDAYEEEMELYTVYGGE